MKVVELADYKCKRKPIGKKGISFSSKSKNHAELLKEAFNALDKVNKTKHS
jgi:hypothetical protein